MGWNCGGTTVKDGGGSVHTVYCGTCSGGTYCQSTPNGDVGVGACGGKNPLQYAWQRQKINMLVAMGENDNTDVNYDYAENIHDGRGYTVGIVGFCTGTGDYIEVARCYEVLKPNNVLSKYWSALVTYENQFLATGMNQGDTSLIDALGPFVQDCALAAKDAEYRACQDTMAETFYMSIALQHAAERGLRGAMTLGFLYDTELNFGDDDDATTPGTKTVLAKADADYGPGMPSDFTGKPWEESKWLGYMVKERTIVMSKDSTWNSDMDQNATWEAARRLNTSSSNSPETGTDLGMDYDFLSRYKAGNGVAGTPCWPSGLASTIDSQSSIYKVFTDKTASATDQTKWKGASDSGGDSYTACPANPTP
jgi:chitosanase